MSGACCQALPGPLRLAHGVVGVGKAGEGLGLVVPVAEFPERAEGVLVAGGGLGMAAKVVLGGAEVVPGVRLVAAVAGSVDIYNASSGTVELVIDCTGYFSAG
jgi:hypothetical protein